jgi:hypothetical protein
MTKKRTTIPPSSNKEMFLLFTIEGMSNNITTNWGMN